MIEQQLKQLQNVTVNDRIKHEDWDKIVQKNRKPPNFYWKEIVAIIAVVSLGFALTYLYKSPTENQAADPFAPIVTIYHSNMKLVDDFEPKSVFYPFVRKFDGEWLDDINKKIQGATWRQLEEAPTGSFVTYKFVYADGSSKILRNYIQEPTEYLYDPKTGYAYILQVESFRETVHSSFMQLHLNAEIDNQQMLVFILLLILFATILLVKNHRYKKETGLQKNPKRYVNKKQQLTQLAIVLILIGATLFTQNVHYGWWIVGLVGNQYLFKLLDDRSEHYSWRVQDNLLHNIWALLLVSTTIYYIFG